MKLSRVAKRFNDTPCRDSYTGEFLFNGQLGVFTEAVRDGITTQRRVLELAPNTQLPHRGCIEFEGVHWILGEGNIDTFKGKTIREKFPIHKSSGLARINTPMEFLGNLQGVEAHAGLIFVKTNKEVEESSSEFVQSTLYFSKSEKVKAHNLITQNGEVYIVKEMYSATAGHLGVIVERVEEPIRETVLVKGDFDPITEKYKETREISVVRLRWQTDFSYYSLNTPTFTRGDMQMIAPLDFEIETGSVLTLSDGKWKVMNQRESEGVQYLHVRRDR